jgi:hypothetical protein
VSLNFQYHPESSILNTCLDVIILSDQMTTLDFGWIRLSLDEMDEEARIQEAMESCFLGQSRSRDERYGYI